ncbi:MAG: hypothetical protein U9N55_03730 [candidate division Zixibacteria bacterium]|nr:hypothetical protein [candidate division Zixibacteria bacterium]
MNMLGFFANLGNSFRNHYLRMTDDITKNRTPEHFYRSTPSQNINRLAPKTQTAPIDRWEPSFEPSPKSKSEQPTQQQQINPEQTNSGIPVDTPKTDGAASSVKIEPTDTYQPSGNTPSEDTSESPNVNPDGTYSLTRISHLDYKLDLRFDLAAISHTVRHLAGGNTTDVEQLVSAGFGLSADFALKGFQITQSNIPESENLTAANLQAQGLNSDIAQKAGLFQTNSRDFALQSFFNNAASQRQSYKVLSHGGYRRSVNKFAMRFKFDNHFSFSHLQRFNVQTQNMAQQMPESLEKYVNSAGNVAQGGTNNMMSTFFDAVDTYLNNAEDKLLDKTISSFEQAAEELGFSGQMVDITREHLTDSIEGFFDRVDTALGKMQSQFAPSSPFTPEIPIEDTAMQPGNIIDPSRINDMNQPIDA